MHRRIAIVTPVLDDWTSFAMLVRDISARFADRGLSFEVTALDDGSVQPFDPASIALPEDTCVRSIDVLQLAVNLGHQRAIAVGLCAIAGREDVDAIIVMDSDGEDRPEDIADLLRKSVDQPAHVIFAQRAKRSEGRVFRFGYALYRRLFRLLTGHSISFGNFVLIPIVAARRLVHRPELWNHMAATIMRSRLRYATVATTRGTRYAGQSRMSFVALILHGMSAMSVYTDMIFVRMLLGGAAIATLSLAGIVAVTVTRFATSLAIPGWATTAAGDLLIILVQAIVLMVATSLMMLSGRSHRPIVPIVDCAQFIAHRERHHYGASAFAHILNPPTLQPDAPNKDPACAPSPHLSAPELVP
jgi:polyisoprenyl-phosphate glycosyltransferase